MQAIKQKPLLTLPLSLSKPVFRHFLQYRSARPPLFILISSTLIALAMTLPLGYLLIRTASVGPKIWDILLRPRTLEVFLNSISLAVAVGLVCITLGISLAWLTVRTDLPGRKFWAVVLSLPLVIPSYLSAFTLVSAFGPKGLVQGWLEPWGIERLPSIYGFWGATLALTMVSYPYVLLSVRGGLKGLDPVMEEAARSLGKSPQHSFWHITLPQLRPSITAGAILAVLYTLSDFGAVAMLQFSSFTQAIYVQYRTAFDRSTAAVLAACLVLVTVVLLAAEVKSRGKAKYYRCSAGAKQTPQIIRLGKWRWPAFIYCTGVATVALLVPVGVIVFWFVRGWFAGEAYLFEWAFLTNSLLAAGIAAIVGIIAAVPVAFLAVRYRSRYTVILEKAAYTGYALPGIVVALSLVFFGANYASFLYQTLALLIFAYVVRFLPQALGTTRASLLQINPHFEEAAQSLGHGPFNTIRTITLPLLRSGLLTGAALVFLTAMKELPATLLLGPTGYWTLAARIWSATEEAFFAQAAAPSLILLGVSAISIMIMLTQEER